MMKIDAEKFLAMTLLLATTAGAPACGKNDAKKPDAKAEVKAVPTAPAAPAPTTPAVVPPPAAAPEVVTPPAADSAGGAAAGGSAGGAAARPDPGPEEEKPSW
jgi:hypothetical protein